MGEDAGSVFVVRNVANMVVATDFNVMAALQFGINVLKIPHIIVCGHYDCGGVRASIENKDHVPPLENWLRNIRDVYRLHQQELDEIDDPEDRCRRLVELNVVEQCINLFKTGAVQRRRVETYKSKQPYSTPRIHACVFDPKVGKLVRLEVCTPPIKQTCMHTNIHVGHPLPIFILSCVLALTMSFWCPSPLHRLIFSNTLLIYMIFMIYIPSMMRIQVLRTWLMPLNNINNYP
jgi:carbonic anhydrase